MSDNLFDELPEDIQLGIHDLGWKEPMPVQARVLPAMLEGGDLIVQAQTGSGKTGAFGIPIVRALDPEQKACQGERIATGELNSLHHTRVCTHLHRLAHDARPHPCCCTTHLLP